MKCTDKEWMHCRVEKMSCKNCYYEDKKETKTNNYQNQKEVENNEK